MHSRNVSNDLLPVTKGCLDMHTSTAQKYQFEQTFADHSHTASVRAVACRNDLLASGGADEIVKLYNMRRRTEAGQLMDHQGEWRTRCFAYLFEFQL